MNVPNSSWSLPEMHCIFYRRLGSTSRLSSNHYETLNLKRDCTSKEIREAFLKLSKEFHPDKNLGNPNNHAEFVKLNEAYTVLSKPHTRTGYDLSLWDPQKPHNYQNRRPFVDSTFWGQRNKSKDRYYRERAYYGINGVKRLPNSWIVAFCFIFTVFGVGMQTLAITKSVTFERDKLDEYSVRNSLLHSQARQQARENGNEIQIELVRQRLNDPKFSGHTGENIVPSHDPKS